MDNQPAPGASQSAPVSGQASNTEATILSPTSAANASSGIANTSNSNPNAGNQSQKTDASGKTDSSTQPNTNAVTGAPEQYADFSVPDTTVIDKGVMDEFKSVAKTLNLPQEAAQKLVDFQFKVNQKAEAEFKSMQESWKNETLKNLGPNSSAELSFAAKFRDQFADSSVLDVLSQSGLGNHPAIVNMFIKAGKAIAEDRFKDGKSSSSDVNTDAARLNRLFPSSAKQ